MTNMVIKISCAKIENLEEKKICNSDPKINLIRIGYWENIVIENYQKSRKRKQGKLIKDMEYIWSPSSNHDGTKIDLTGRNTSKNLFKFEIQEKKLSWHQKVAVWFLQNVEKTKKTKSRVSYFINEIWLFFNSTKYPNPSNGFSGTSQENTHTTSHCWKQKSSNKSINIKKSPFHYYIHN